MRAGGVAVLSEPEKLQAAEAGLQEMIVMMAKLCCTLGFLKSAHAWLPPPDIDLISTRCDLASDFYFKAPR